MTKTTKGGKESVVMELYVVFHAQIVSFVAQFYLQPRFAVFWFTKRIVKL